MRVVSFEWWAPLQEGASGRDAQGIGSGESEVYPDPPTFPLPRSSTGTLRALACAERVPYRSDEWYRVLPSHKS